MQSKRQGNIISHSLNGHMLTFAAAGVGEFTVNLKKVIGTEESDMWEALTDVGRAAVVNGVKQKVDDRAAIGRDPETGASATPEEKFAAMRECAERLMSGGPWNAVATGGGGNQGGLLYRAMRALYPQAWSDKTSFAAYIMQKAISESARLGKRVSETDVRNGLMATKKIAKEISRIRAEEGGVLAQMDTNGMLQELEGK